MYARYLTDDFLPAVSFFQPTPPSLEPWRQMLLAAAGDIERRGHTKGHLHNDSGASCAMGALARVSLRVSLTEADYAVRARAFFALSATIPDIYAGNVGLWNDHPSTTAAEVIATMRRAALDGVA